MVFLPAESQMRLAAGVEIDRTILFARGACLFVATERLSLSRADDALEIDGN